jgi:hypothetical protein
MTQKKLERVRLMLGEGKTVKQVAKALGVCRATVHNAMKTLGMPRKLANHAVVGEPRGDVVGFCADVLNPCREESVNQLGKKYGIAEGSVQGLARDARAGKLPIVHAHIISDELQNEIFFCFLSRLFPDGVPDGGIDATMRLLSERFLDFHTAPPTVIANVRARLAEAAATDALIRRGVVN